ncbi:hypothetical protein LTR08_003570 [Meristemomyces frigidus]|nr:hypothetical protein LTR08_003570 [Meristemomyces frigidus]
MAKSKAKGAEMVQQPTPPTQDEEDSDIDIMVDGEEDKDATEQELERLVFGDSAGFREGLRDFALDQQESGSESEEDAQAGLEGLDDADLFFTDTGDATAQAAAASDSGDDATARARHPAAWEDSDDERTLVSLASAPRLRKLRRTEAEDVVNGRDYAKRLRRQFELLSPRPEWATHAMQGATKKRRASANAGSDDEASSNDDMDLDDDTPSVAPLDALLRDASTLIRSTTTGSKKRKLRPEVIDIQRIKDLPLTQPSPITSLSFHPTLPLLLSSGPSSTLYLHHLAPSPPAPTANPLLTSLHIRGTALTTTAFHPTDPRIFLAARRRFFHVWNLHTGRVAKIARVYGHQHDQRSMERFKLSPDGASMALLGSARKGGGVINILSAATLQWVAQVRIESRGGIADFCWWRDSRGLCIAGKSGEVTEWALASQSVVARWQDEGAVGTTTLALGGQHEFVKAAFGNDRWVVVGSSSGVVNIYDRRVWLSPASTSGSSSTTTSTHQTQQQGLVPANPKPTKTLQHLTTPTSHLAFSPDGQLLVVASKWKRDALRLVHLPSCTVFQNWPTSATALGRITAVAVAGGEVARGGAGGDVWGVLAVANEQGRVRLWEVR